MVALGPKAGLSDSKANTLQHHTMLSTEVLLMIFNSNETEIMIPILQI